MDPPDSYAEVSDLSRKTAEMTRPTPRRGLVRQPIPSQTLSDPAKRVRPDLQCAWSAKHHCREKSPSQTTRQTSCTASDEANEIV